MNLVRAVLHLSGGILVNSGEILVSHSRKLLNQLQILWELQKKFSVRDFTGILVSHREELMKTGNRQSPELSGEGSIFPQRSYSYKFDFPIRNLSDFADYS
ncbi:hypothetical protein H6F89_21000 [Cyanobacteria bacterium FACHB-63]|nr:hypothetical protein [Cyanobacteria bacterium FACHB-63]